MKYKLVYLPKSLEDRTAIRDYLSQFYPGTAKKFFTMLRKSNARLRDFPLSCPIYEDNPKYRKLVVGDYLVFYTVNEDAKLIEIRRILHGSRSITVEQL